MHETESSAPANRLFTSIARALAVVIIGMAVAGCAPSAGTPEAEAQTAGFEHYRNARYGYKLDYPAAFDLAPPPANGDGRVMRGADVTLRVFGVQMLEKSLRDIASARVGDAANASEVQNSRGSVVMVEDDPGEARTVKAIALAGERAAVLVIDGSMANTARREHVLASFRPVADKAAGDRATDAGKRYKNAAMGFSIVHPRGARVSSEGANRVKFTVLGPANEAASEITDGFSVIVQRKRSSAETLAGYARQQRPGEAVSAESVRVGPHRAWRYRETSELGQTVTHWLFMPAAGRAYHVSAIVSGAESQYREQLQAMLASLQFG